MNDCLALLGMVRTSGFNLDFGLQLSLACIAGREGNGRIVMGT